MAAVKKPKTRLLPQGAVAWLAGLGLRLSGLVALAAVAVLAAALISYDPHDASLNTLSSQPVRNLLGAPGAIFADLMMQSFGHGAFALILVLVAWALRLSIAAHLPKALKWRAAIMILALPFSSVALVVAPMIWTINLPVNGGVLGRLLAPIALSSGLSLPILSAGIMGCAAILLLFAMGIAPGEWLCSARAVWAMIGKVRLPSLGRSREKSRPVPFSRPTSAPLMRSQPEAAPVAPPQEIELGKTGETRPQPPRREAKPSAAKPERRSHDPASLYSLPPMDLLNLASIHDRGPIIDEAALRDNARALETVLQDFGVNGEIVKIRPGPVVTLYELEPAPGTKTSRVVGLADDIARSMRALSVRIAVVPGRSVIGIELPNAKREMVYLRELLQAEDQQRGQHGLNLALGKDIGGASVMVDLARMPHLLIAGTTGSGKSVAVNTMILSLLYRLTPEQCRLIMIDPKMLELSVYDGIPHLLAPVVTEPGKAVVALKWAVREMEDRYRAMSQLGVRNIAGYNQRLAEARARGEKLSRTVQTGFDPATGKPIYEDQDLNLDPLPFIVVIVDEMADLMLVAGKDIEAAVQRLAQMARAAGIHLIMATQRPSVDVITGTIKANFPTRISFQVTSKIDSRTILGEQGAEQLLGQGDMLYMASGGRITRVHGPFVSDREVEKVVEYLRSQGEPAYIDSVTEEEDERMPIDMAGSSDEPLYDQAVALVIRDGKASTSYIQRCLQIGYNRAARLIERMEAEGVVSRANHVGKREILARQNHDH